jgi:hypothetical protein
MAEQPDSAIATEVRAWYDDYIEALWARGTRRDF